MVNDDRSCFVQISDCNPLTSEMTSLAMLVASVVEKQALPLSLLSVRLSLLVMVASLFVVVVWFGFVLVWLWFGFSFVCSRLLAV